MISFELPPHYAGWGLTPVTRFSAQQNLLRRRQCGHIVVEHSRLVAIYARWWPYFGNLLQAACDQRCRHQMDRCELYFHVPWTAPHFLTLSYIRSGIKTTPATVMAACKVLEEIAKLKNSVAIVSHITNDRISDRVMERWGWETHCPSLPGRHFIKRFYGKYPSVSEAWRVRLGL